MLKNGLELTRSTAADIKGLLRNLFDQSLTKLKVDDGLKIIAPVFGVILIILFIPWASLRGDDWRIIGAAHQATGSVWTWIQSGTLWGANGETVWFFRPGFKGLVYAGYQIFGTTALPWFLSLTVLAGAGVLQGEKALSEFGVSRLGSRGFGTLLLASHSLFLGSLLWLGEGLMNIPQWFLLSFSLMGTAEALNQKKSGTKGLVAFALALTFKESAIFHLPFLLTAFAIEPSLQKVSLRRRAQILAPYLGIGFGYLWVRLGRYPLNPGYLPYFDLKLWLPGLFRFALVLAVPIAGWMIGFEPDKNTVQRKLFYIPALLLSLLPYLGHPFFSPGWFLLPGFYCLFFLTLAPAPTSPSSTRSVSPESASRLSWVVILVFVFSLSVSIDKLQRWRWWQWKEAQLQVMEQLKTMASAKAVSIEDCGGARNFEQRFRRVVGDEDSLEGMRILLGQSPKQFSIRPCGSPPDANARWLRWEGPGRGRS